MRSSQRLRDLAVSESGFVFDPYSGQTYSLNATGRVHPRGAPARRVARAPIEAALRAAFEVGPGAPTSPATSASSSCSRPRAGLALPGRDRARERCRASLTVAVTGLNATDNPAPGVAVIRSLRAAPGFRGRCSSASPTTRSTPGSTPRDSGSTRRFLIPYPSQGVEALARAAPRRSTRRCRIDVIIPTLDSELPAFIALEPELRELGHPDVPARPASSSSSARRCASPSSGEGAGSTCRAQRVLSDVAERLPAPRRPALPAGGQGRLLRRHASPTASTRPPPPSTRPSRKWGLPVIVQQFHAGRGVRRRRGRRRPGRPGRRGAHEEDAAHRQGQGLGGRRRRRTRHLLETDPALHRRDLAGAARARSRSCGPRRGATCSSRSTRASRPGSTSPPAPGRTCPGPSSGWRSASRSAPLPDYRAGTLFVRISLDQIATMDDFQELAADGELLRAREVTPDDRRRSPPTSGPPSSGTSAGLMNKFARVAAAMRPLTDIDGVAGRRPGRAVRLAALRLLREDAWSTRDRELARRAWRSRLPTRPARLVLQDQLPRRGLPGLPPRGLAAPRW